MRIELFAGARPAGSSPGAYDERRRPDATLRSWRAATLRPGAYRLVFHVGEYFRSRGHPDAGRFLEEVPVVFVVDDPEGKYHVPLLVSPWSYTTYRGS